MDRNEDAVVESARIAATAVRTWHEMSVRLSPIIGEGGFALLYRRSLHLASSRFPWLAGIPSPSKSPFSGFGTALESQVPSDAAEASGALVCTFTELLHTLIGEALTTRLLAPLPRDEDPDAHAQEVSP